MRFFNHKKIIANHPKKSGFTLVEMMVAVFVFSVVMVLSTGAIFSIVNANKTSQALKSVMDNLSSAIDSMSREIRYGTIYNCGNKSSNFPQRESCDEDGGVTFSFVNKDGYHVAYRYDQPGMFIEKCVDVNGSGMDNCQPIRLTAPEVKITDMRFYVQGASVNESGQPKLLMTISGYAQAGVNQSKFNIETMVSQRNIDMCKDDVPEFMQPSDC